METLKDNDMDLIAKESFLPILDEEYSEKLKNLIHKLSTVYCSYKMQVITEEINKYKVNNDSSLGTLRYIATLNILLDLMQQGWTLDIDNEKIFLKLANDNANDKEHIRYRLSSERNAQFKSASVIDFITRMETPKNYGGNYISIIDLVGDANQLISKINNGSKIVEPYIQLVTNIRDEHTGYKLSDIWKYFRYTWSIPYKTMPGRNLFYLVRDASQRYHPIIGIFALGNTVLNLTVRDDDIGWTVEAIKKNMLRKIKTIHCSQKLSQTNGKEIITKKTIYLETEDEYKKRIDIYAKNIISVIQKSISDSINDIYVKDLNYHRQMRHPTIEKIAELKKVADDLRDQVIDNKKNTNVTDWEAEAQTKLFKKKRALELSKLLDAVYIIDSKKKDTPVEWINELLKTEQGRKAINIALIANRKNKIGSNMMEIIVCGAIPPYNELLGGKLISILACSPKVIFDYTNKYSKQVSEIASRMKGKRVIRDSRLAFLGTTSLYSIGSSQYNRIKVIKGNRGIFEYRKIGVTEGFGTIYFSKQTTSLLSHILERQDGGKKINHIFGEGTSPRFRLISRGLGTLGIKADAFLQHHSPRIVYSIDLAKNTKDFLMGFTNELDYYFDITNESSVKETTEELINFWYHRWLMTRLTTVDIINRLKSFDINNLLLGRVK